MVLKQVLADISCCSFWGVFWIDATTDATAEMGFAEIGGIAKKDTTFAAGMHWLSNCQESWLLVIDNADSHDMDVSRYFPAGGRGHIILTTRNPNNVVHATIGEASFRELEEEDAITLLLKAARQPGAEDYKDIRQRQLARPITAALGYLAIAIIHAGATIRRRLYTLESYLRVYEKELMNQKLLPSANPSERSIATTYEIPFGETMKRTDLAAVDATQILQIFAFLHFQQIPATIFRRAWSNLQNTLIPEPNGPSRMFDFWFRSSQKDKHGTKTGNQNVPALLDQVTWDDRRLQDALAVLYDLSFIYYDNTKQMCWMHPMIRLWARSRLSLEEQKHWLEIATNLLAYSISPAYEPAGRDFRRSLIPHIAACLQTRQSAAQSLGFSSKIYQGPVAERFAAVYSEVGDWKKSRDINKKVLSIRKKEFGPEHPETLRCMVELGKVYWDLFDIDNAISIQLEVCEIRGRILGKDDPLTLSAISELTATYWLAGDRLKSLNYGEKAVSGLSNSLGLDDPITLTAIFHLARTQYHLGKVEDARLGLERVLTARKTFFGTKHPDTIMAMAELGIVYHSLQQTAEAETLLLEVLKIRTEILGEEHGYTLWTINDLSKVYTDSGRAQLALKMLDAMIPVVVRTVGHRHVGMNMTKYNLARAYNALGRWLDGEKVLINQIGHLFSTHPDHIIATAELAWVYKNLKRFDEAEKSYLNVLDEMTAGLQRGVNQVHIRRVARQLEDTYVETGQQTKIDGLRKRVAALIEQQ
jgi:tetratricopeptide (TPR) repeat protein